METSNLEKRHEAQARKTWRLLLVAAIALLLGLGAGVGLNFIFAEPEKVVRGDATQKSDTPGSGQAARETARGPAAPSEFDINRAMSDVFALSEQIGERPCGSGGEDSAANYVVQQLGEAGYAVEEQPFITPEGSGTRNIIATRTGKSDGYVFVVGAHLDSAEGAKGGVDNASGVGVVLEIARVFSNTRIEPTLKFVFFGANRPGATAVEERFSGGRRFIGMLGKLDRKEIAGMVAVDCVACGDYLAFRTQETGVQRLRDKMAAKAREDGLPVVTLKADEDSDNIPFEDAQVAAVWLQWCEAGGKVAADDSYAGVLAGNVEQAGNFLGKFLAELTQDDLRELKY